MAVIRFMWFDMLAELEFAGVPSGQGHVQADGVGELAA